MLPSLVPDARIWTFCYNSKWQGEAPIQQIDTLADQLIVLIHQHRHASDRRKPIVFLAHSFGGIVLEAALTAKSMSADQYAHILRATTGAVFLGTPFRGSAAAQQALYIADTAKALGFKASTTLLENLLPDSEALATLLSDFAKTAIKECLNVVCFFEQLPTRMVRDSGFWTGWLSRMTESVIVPRPQAILEAHQDIGLGTSHTKMNEFSGPEDHNYKLVSGQILEIIDSSSKTFQKKSQTTKTGAFAVIPYLQNPDFVGRDDILQQIAVHLNSGRKRAALYGLGGVGKSQIAIQYAHLVREKSPKRSVFWVHAASRARFEQSYLEIAREVGLSLQPGQASDNLESLKHWLESEASGEWLLIVDNADDISLFTKRAAINAEVRTGEEFLSKFLPDSLRGCTFFTSRDKKLCIELVGARSTVQVDEMNLEDCKKLMAKFLTDDFYQSGDIEILIRLLHQIPLALAQSAAYMEQNATSVPEYVELFHGSEESQVDLLSEEFRALGRDDEAFNAITRTWRISFDQIQERQPLAAHLLSIMAFFDKQDIPKELLPHDNHSEIDFQKALGTLQAFSMISASASATGYDIHRLVQVSTRRWLQESGEASRLVSEAVAVLSDKYPSSGFENWQNCACYLPHAQSVVNYAWMLKVDSEKEDLLIYNVGGYLNTQGEYSRAEIYLKRSLELSQNSLGMEDLSTLMSMANLALTYRNQGHWDKAEELEVQVMETSSRVLGKEHPDTLTSMANLASTYHHQGHWDKAEELEVQVMEMSSRVLGKEHPDTLTSMGNLASTYRNQGHWDKAEELFFQVMETMQRVLGKEHPSTLTTMANLAHTWKKQGKKKEAIGLMQQSVSLSEMKLGLEHPDTTSRKKDLQKWLVLNLIEQVGL